MGPCWKKTSPIASGVWTFGLHNVVWGSIGGGALLKEVSRGMDGLSDFISSSHWLLRIYGKRWDFSVSRSCRLTLIFTPNTKLDSHPSGIISRNKLFLCKSLWVMFYNSKVTSTGQSPWLEEVEAWPSSCLLALLGTGFIVCVTRTLNRFSLCFLMPLLQTCSLVVGLAVFNFLFWW